MEDSIKIKAMRTAVGSNELSSEEKIQLDLSLSQYRTFGLGAKVALVGTLLAVVDWKRNPGFLVRELPLSVAAVAGCLCIDKLTETYVWKPNEAAVKRVTGFNGEMFVNPESLKNMKEMYKTRKARQ